MVKVSVIIPIATDGARGPQLRDRLARLLKTLSPSAIETIVGDSSTIDPGANRLICEKHGAKWVAAVKPGTFSPGYARDCAVREASGSHLFLMDADLVGPPDLPELLQKEASAIEPDTGAFIIAPCLYLTPEGTRELEEGKLTVPGLWRAYLQGDFSRTINLASASSAILVGRSHYLALGGHNPAFAGHGYEDMELLLRLTLNHPLGRIESDLKIDARQESIADSKGFRRYFTYYAIEPALRGLVLAHLAHPRHLWGRFRRSRTQNERRFNGMLEEALADHKGGTLPALPPLGDYILSALEKLGLTKEEGRGLYKNQWREAPPLSRFRRKLVKLLTNPSRFFRDIVKAK